MACGERITLLDMIAILNSLVGREIAVEFVPPRPGEVRHSQAAIGRAAELLDYRPSSTFARACAHLRLVPRQETVPVV